MGEAGVKREKDVCWGWKWTREMGPGSRGRSRAGRRLLASAERECS